MSSESGIQHQTVSYAGFWWRFLASFLDGIFLFLVNIALSLGIGVALGILMLASGEHGNAAQVLAHLIGTVTGIVMGWLYQALFWASELQATPGKLICGIKVTDANGHRLTFAHATGRHFAMWVSNMTLLIGYIMAAFTAKKQALHDMIAGTLVVKK